MIDKEIIVEVLLPSATGIHKFSLKLTVHIVIFINKRYAQEWVEYDLKQMTIS